MKTICILRLRIIILWLGKEVCQDIQEIEINQKQPDSVSLFTLFRQDHGVCLLEYSGKEIFILVNHAGNDMHL